jgi:hypothetical protein
MKKHKFIMLFIILIFSYQSVANQYCSDEQESPTPDSRYTIYTDGTAIDHQTNLIWMRCTIGRTINSNTNNCDRFSEAPKYIWKDALDLASNYTFAGHSDWRLPNIKELISIIDTTCAVPAANKNIFPSLERNDTGYWSSTLQKSFEGGVNVVLFANGRSVFTTVESSHFILLVRSTE